MASNNDLNETQNDAEPKPPTVVGIGASAGGLAALKSFFEQVPADSGVVFVVVVHLSPEHKSLLADVLQPHVKMPVQQVTETTPLEINRVYVIPPNANLSAIDTHLRLSKLEQERRERAPIDHFFRTLAATHDGHAIGVVLTGTGSDGTLGVREIKARGGVIVVQDPNEAEFDGMPQSAIATGVVDMILPVADIPEAILRVIQTEPQVPHAAGLERGVIQEDPLPKVLGLLRARTDRDFTRYKRATILRRIARRMQLNYLEDFEAYLARMRENPEEAKALADDLLITVTSFFRDPEVFQTLEQHILPKLFERKSGSDFVRVWSVGCATGEEAYSLAMLLVERASFCELPPRIQVFASDLHRHSLEKAREGFYPGDIEADINPERLKRFFRKENGGFRVTKELRDLVVFAPHNLLNDPPFSRLDMISCRNLLIYLERDVQRDVIELFHYSLCPGGHLLLGSAEVVDNTDLFRTEDKKLCLYSKRNVPPIEPRLPVFPMTKGRSPIAPSVPPALPLAPYGEMHQSIVERYAPPSMLINGEDKVVHLSERAGRYLVHPGGELTPNAVKLVRAELQIELRALLQTARETRQPQDSKPIGVQFNGHPNPVVLRVRPSLEREEDGFVVVIFEEGEPVPERPKNDPDLTEGSPPSSGRIVELEEELHQTRQRLQATIEEFESSREEMRASNEEMQSTNEELRSTMEELETSKEELQSINEELQTVNQENRHKVDELSQLSSDLHNLLSATNIATLFLDRELRILRFTPKLGELFNVRQTDRGRPISDLTTRIGYPDMQADASKVLNSLSSIERELQDEAGQWFLTRVLPYRSAEDRIAGVVITFVDITGRKLAEEAARASEQRIAVELEAMRRLHGLVARLMIAPDVTTALREVLDAAVEITGADMGTIQIYDATTSTLNPVAQRGFHNDFVQHLVDLGTNEAAPFGRALKSRRRVIIPDIRADGPYQPHLQAAQKAGYAAVQSSPLTIRDGRVLGVLSTYYVRPSTPSERDLRLLDLYTQQAADYIEGRRAEQELATSLSAKYYSEQKYQQLFESIDEGFCIVQVLADDNGHAQDFHFVEINPAFEKNTGIVNATGKSVREALPGEERTWLATCGRIAFAGTPERFEAHSPSLRRHWDVYAFRTGEPSQRRVAMVLRDITERKAGEERQNLLLRELNHRVKNTLAMVQSIASQTMLSAPSPQEFAEKFNGRLTTLAEAHDLLVHSNWEGAELNDMLHRVLFQQTDNGRIVISGPPVVLPPQAALGLSMVMYELATNARKYGALSTNSGRIRVTWNVEGLDGNKRLDLDWIERDGPPVTAPANSGFGRTLVEQALKGVGGTSTLQFDSGGVSCRILLPLPPRRFPGGSSD